MHPKADFTPEKVLEIKRKFAMGATLASLQRAYGGSISTIRRIAMGLWQPKKG